MSKAPLSTSGNTFSNRSSFSSSTIVVVVEAPLLAKEDEEVGMPEKLARLASRCKLGEEPGEEGEVVEYMLTSMLAREVPGIRGPIGLPEAVEAREEEEGAEMSGWPIEGRRALCDDEVVEEEEEERDPPGPWMEPNDPEPPVDRLLAFLPSPLKNDPFGLMALGLPLVPEAE